jgi:hypothetical protein
VTERDSDEAVRVFALNVIRDVANFAGISSEARVVVIRAVVQHLDARDK